MGIFNLNREARLGLKLRIDSQVAYNTLLKAFSRSGLKIKSKDKLSLTAVAEWPLLKSIFSNSYGEVVVFSISELESEGYCIVSISSQGKYPLGSYSHKIIFQKIQDSLQKDLGVEVVQGIDRENI